MFDSARFDPPNNQPVSSAAKQRDVFWGEQAAAGIGRMIEPEGCSLDMFDSRESKGTRPTPPIKGIMNWWWFFIAPTP